MLANNAGILLLTAVVVVAALGLIGFLGYELFALIKALIEDLQPAQPEQAEADEGAEIYTPISNEVLEARRSREAVQRLIDYFEGDEKAAGD